MPKTSPLYNLVASFSDKQLKAYGIEKKETATRSYFIIRTSKDIKSVLTDNDSLQEAHFSIDQYYNMDRHGYTPIHYTLDYGHTTIHGYLDVRGQYKYCQSSPSVPSLSPKQEQALQNAIQSAKLPLSRLLIKQSEHQAELTKKADHLDRELSNLSRTLDHKKVRDDYIKKAHEFIEIIQELNLYNNSIDRRYISMSRLVDRIQSIYECLNKKQPKTASVEKSKEIKDESQASGAKPHEPVLSPQERLAKLYQDAMHNFHQSVQKFSDPNQNLDQLKENVKIINENLFILYSFPEAMISKKNNTKISKVLTKLSDFYNKNLETLKQVALSGDRDEFETMFRTDREYFNDDFYGFLVNYLVENKWGPKSDKVLEICNFLSENDENYEDFILNFSRKKAYPASLKDLSILSEKETFKEDTLVQVSLLLRLYLDDKIDLFKAFLRQGADARTWSIQSTPKDTCCNYYTLFYIIALSSKKNYLDYLKLLIDSGIDPNVITQKTTASDRNQLTLQAFQKHIKTHTPGAFDYPSFHPINSLSVKSGIEGLNLLLTTAPLNALVIHWGELLNHSILNYMMVATSQYILYYASSFADATRCYEENLNPEQKSSQYFSCYIPYPKEDNSPEENQAVHEIYAKMKRIDEEIDRRFSDMSINDLKRHYQNLFDLAGKILLSKDYFDLDEYHAYYHFFGCEVLLMKYLSKHSEQFTDPRSFLGKYAITLYPGIISSLAHNPSHSDRINFYFENIKFFKMDTLVLKPFDPLLTLLDQAQEGDPEKLKMPLTEMSLSSLAIGLAGLVDLSPVLGYLIVPTDQYNVCYAKSQQQAHEKATELSYSSESRKIFSCYIPYPRITNTSEDAKKVDDYYTLMKRIDSEIDRRLSQMAPNIFKKHYEELLDLSKKEYPKMHCYNAKKPAYFCLFGCELLLMRYVAKQYTEFTKQRSFIKEYAVTLYHGLLSNLLLDRQNATKMVFYSQNLEFFVEENKGETKETVIRPKGPRRKKH